MVVRAPSQLVDKAVMEFLRGVAERPQTAPRRPRVITISRQLGGEGREIAETLGNWLRWPLWDKEILEAVASQSILRHQAREFEALDEKVQSNLDAFASSLLGDVDKHVYFHLLPRAVRAIGRQDAIILGRGAYLVLPDSLKVKIVASVPTRVKRLVRQEGLSLEEARKRIRASDQGRDAFLQELAGRLGLRRSQSDREAEFDLVVNTDGIGVERAASMILAFARQKLELGDAGGGATRSGEPIARGGLMATPAALW